MYNWFRRGLKPLESQFAAWLDAYWHKDEAIPTSAVDGLDGALSLFSVPVETVDTAGSTITLDMANLKQKSFVGSAAIGAAKTIAFSNITNAVVIPFFRFTLSAAYPLTFSNVKMSLTGINSGNWERNNANEWQPDAAGEYEAYLTHNAGQWRVRIEGPF